MAGHVKDLKGKRFGRLTVIEFSQLGRGNRRGAFWNCRCECGNLVEIASSSLIGDRTKSCGCLQKEIATEHILSAQKTHGMSGSRPYRIWGLLKSRCNDDPRGYYGDRGISYPSKWETFEGFWEDMSEGYSDELTLDRIDVNGDYCKENCRWVEHSLQQFNKRKYKRNTSGRTGVKLDKKSGKWVAEINVNKKRIHLGLFELFEDAVKAREQAEFVYFGFIKE